MSWDGQQPRPQKRTDDQRAAFVVGGSCLSLLVTFGLVAFFALAGLAGLLGWLLADLT